MALYKSIGYQVSLVGYGWKQGVLYDGMIAGARTVAINAVQIMSPLLKYRVESGGVWSGWATNGGTAGNPAGAAVTGLQVTLVTPAAGRDFLVRALLGAAWSETLASLGVDYSNGSALNLLQVCAIVPAADVTVAGVASARVAGVATAPVAAVATGATPLERFNYVKDSIACIASIAAVGAACIETAGLACAAAGGALFVACASAVQTGAVFVTAEMGGSPTAGTTVSSPAPSQPGDTTDAGPGGDPGGGDPGGGDPGGGDPGGGDPGGGDPGGGDPGGGDPGGGDPGGGDPGGGDPGGGEGGDCFVAGTPVLMADGSSRAIEAVQPGDVVQSLNEADGTTIGQTVLATRAATVPSTVRLRLSSGNTLEVSGRQKLFAASGEAIRASAVTPGTSLRSVSGATVGVLSQEVVNQPSEVHHIELQDGQSLFAQRIHVPVRKD